MPLSLIRKAEIVLASIPDPVERAWFYIRSPLCPDSVKLTGGAVLKYLHEYEDWSDAELRKQAGRIVEVLSRPDNHFITAKELDNHPALRPGTVENFRSISGPGAIETSPLDEEIFP